MLVALGQCVLQTLYSETLRSQLGVSLCDLGELRYYLMQIVN